MSDRPIEGPVSSRPNVGQLASDLEPDNTLHRGGAACSTYFRAVRREIPNSRATFRRERPSTSTLCLMTWT